MSIFLKSLLNYLTFKDDWIRDPDTGIYYRGFWRIEEYDSCALLVHRFSGETVRCANLSDAKMEADLFEQAESMI